MNGELCERYGRMSGGANSDVHLPKRWCRKWIGRVVFGLGISLVAVLAVPTGILLSLIYGVWAVTDRIMAASEKMEKQDTDMQSPD